MVAAVDGAGRAAVELGKQAARFECCGVLEVARFGARREIGVAMSKCAWMLGFQVLDQGALLVDVKDLAAEADGQNRFSRFETVVEDSIVRLLAVAVERGCFGVRGGLEARRIDVGRAAGKNKPI